MPEPMSMDRAKVLAEYAVGDAQKAHFAAILKHGSIRKAAKAIGVNHSTILGTVDSASAKYARVANGEHLDPTAPPGYAIKGTSTLNRFGEDGGSTPALQWVKTERDAEVMHQLREEACRAMGESIPKAKPVKAPAPKSDELCNVFVVTDYHLGMAGWGEETKDDNWDIKIAEDLLVRWFAQAIQQAPDGHTAVLAQLGDFLHWDGLEALTPTNKHLLDADTRFALVVRVAIRVLRRVIQMLLESHQHVHVICAEGNHDPASSIWLREWFAVLYADEPRVTVDQSPNPYYAFEWGDCSLFFHHGHLKGVKNVDQAFTASFRELFGRTRHSFAHMGHYHHQVMVETNLMVVEQHRTLAAKDAYAARGGYEAGRDASVITYHNQHGRVGRVYLSPEAVTP